MRHTNDGHTIPKIPVGNGDKYENPLNGKTYTVEKSTGFDVLLVNTRNDADTEWVPVNRFTEQYVAE